MPQETGDRVADHGAGGSEVTRGSVDMIAGHGPQGSEVTRGPPGTGAGHDGIAK